MVIVKLVWAAEASALGRQLGGSECKGSLCSLLYKNHLAANFVSAASQHEPRSRGQQVTLYAFMLTSWP